MAKANKLSLFEHARIVVLHQPGLSQRAVAAEVGRSNAVILNLLKDPEGYGEKKSRVLEPKKCHRPRTRGSIWLGLGLGPSAQMKLVAGANCSPMTVGRRLREGGFNT